MKEQRIFQLVAGDPALDLVNTLDWRFRDSGTEELIASYADLLDFAVQSGLLTVAQRRRIEQTAAAKAAARALEDCRALREAAAQVFYAVTTGRTPSPVQIAALEEFFARARRHRNATWQQNRLTWRWEAAEDSCRLPLWMLSHSVESLLSSERMEQLRQCGNPECRWLFVDTSKNHARRWCDMRLCGNRMKARRFRAQHALRPAPVD